ncbi:MAG: alpha/beta fold hydrolase [Burkholderiaceae bacterium]
MEALPTVESIEAADVRDDVAALLSGCEHMVCQVRTAEGLVRIPVSCRGTGPPLLLLHGHPQSRVIWHRLLPELARHFSVVLTDLRGYGDADSPADAPGAAPHSAQGKRAMAADQVAVMSALGHPAFAVVGHDRGARVAHRMGLDWPARIRAMMLLDIAPTLSMLEQTDLAFASAYWHWFFLVQPAPFPERMIAADPQAWLQGLMGNRIKGPSPFAEAAWREYLHHLGRPQIVHSICEDYRAAAGSDAELDRADRDRGHRLSCRLRVHWGAEGIIGRLYNPLSEWRAACHDDVRVDGGPMPCGHYLPEQAPQAVLASVLDDWYPGQAEV